MIEYHPLASLKITWHDIHQTSELWLLLSQFDVRTVEIQLEDCSELATSKETVIIQWFSLTAALFSKTKLNVVAYKCVNDFCIGTWRGSSHDTSYTAEMCHLLHPWVPECYAFPMCPLRPHGKGTISTTVFFVSNALSSAHWWTAQSHLDTIWGGLLVLR